jgi:hypothetical protein
VRDPASLGRSALLPGKGDARKTPSHDGGGSRRRIAFLTEPAVVRKILANLGHPTEPPVPAPARSTDRLDLA